MLPTDFDLDAAARADAGDSIERVGPPSSPRAADSSQASMPATRPAAGRSAARSVASAFLGDFDDDEYDDDDAGASMSIMEGTIRGSIPYKLIAIAVSLGVVAFVLGFWWFVLREPAETAMGTTDDAGTTGDTSGETTAAGDTTAAPEPEPEVIEELAPEPEAPAAEEAPSTPGFGFGAGLE